MGSGSPEANPSRSGNGISMREFFESLLTERDRRYEERFISQDRFVLSKLSGIQTATDKVADQLTEFKAANNEWRARAKDQTDNQPTRVEVNTRFTSIETVLGLIQKEIATIREGRSGDIGQAAGNRESRAEVRYALGLAIALGAAAAGYFIK